MRASQNSNFLHRLRRWALSSTRRPAVGKVDMGILRRVSPLSRSWGFDRGKPIDRHYIECFLGSFRRFIRGRVLEIGDDRYTSLFGSEQVDSVDILGYDDSCRKATIVGDLVDLPEIPDDQFDCIICTQTLQFVSDPSSAIATLLRILKPGGLLLLTVPTISQLDADPAAAWQDRWRFTSTAMHDLLARNVRPEDTWRWASYGNVLAATAFLYGMAASELESEELDHHDPAYEMLVTVSLMKGPGTQDASSGTACRSTLNHATLDS